LEGCVRRGLSDTEAEQIRRVAFDGSRRIEGQLLPAASRHGDFTPRNVLAADDRISVVDFENFVPVDTIYEDVSKFVAFLALLKGRPGYSKRAVDSVIASFLEGYGTVEGSLVGLFSLKAALRIFAYRGARRTAKSLMLDPFYTKQLIHLGREYARTLDLVS
jgi:Ser/Thr protein kinase RdoA (MazF antagonist)